jgi:hypothetical protein
MPPETRLRLQHLGHVSQRACQESKQALSIFWDICHSGYHKAKQDSEHINTHIGPTKMSSIEKNPLPEPLALRDDYRAWRFVLANTPANPLVSLTVAKPAEGVLRVEL